MSKGLNQILDPASQRDLCIFSEPGLEAPVWVSELDQAEGALRDGQDVVFSPPFFIERAKSSSWAGIKAGFKISKSDFRAIINEYDLTPFDSVFGVAPEQKKLFLAEGAALKKALEQSRLQKGVPYAFADAQALAPNRLQQLTILKSCLNQQELTGGYVYAWLQSDAGILGLSPELLFEKKSHLLRTVALAGTRNLSHVTEEDFLNDPKENLEHNLVIKGISESLAPFGAVQVYKTGTRASAGLTHLETQVEVALDSTSGDASLVSLVQALHPTPALGGFPRAEAGEWLSQFETKNPRSRFGAPFAVRLEGKEICIVAIRGLEWNRSFCRIGVGCGFVKESQPEKEWQELNHKWASTGRSLGLRIEPL